MRPGILLATGVALGLVVHTGPCEAQSPLRRGGTTIQISTGMALQHLAGLPSVGTSQLHARERTTRGSLASTGPATLLGPESGFDLVLRDRLVLPLFALNFSWAVGRYPTVYGSIDGSVVEQQPWKAWQMQAYLGGIGARWKRRRWAFGAALQPGIAVTSLATRIPDGAASQKGNLSGVDLAVRGTTEACRRFSPEERGCVFFGLHVFQDRFFNGGVVGLRWELGP